MRLDVEEMSSIILDSELSSYLQCRVRACYVKCQQNETYKIFYMLCCIKLSFLTCCQHNHFRFEAEIQHVLVPLMSKLLNESLGADLPLDEVQRIVLNLDVT